MRFLSLLLILPSCFAFNIHIINHTKFAIPVVGKPMSQRCLGKIYDTLNPEEVLHVHCKTKPHYGVSVFYPKTLFPRFITLALRNFNTSPIIRMIGCKNTDYQCKWNYDLGKQTLTLSIAQNPPVIIPKPPTPHMCLPPEK